MADLLYNFLDNNFTTYLPVRETKKPVMKYPLSDIDIELPSGFSSVSSNGTLIADDIIEKDNPKFIVNNTEEHKMNNTIETTVNNKSNLKVQGPNSFNKLLDEVSNEDGFEDLKNPEIRLIITSQAARESRFTSNATNNSSTASGYFQFIDSTRKNFSSYNRNDFINDPKELIRTAVKYLRYIFNSPNAKKLLLKGYNKKQVAALGWWYPKSMDMVLDGETNFSKGGYSIKQALLDYA